MRTTVSKLIYNELHRRIVSGELPPGCPLPSHVDLKAEFAASIQTIQRAVDRLAQEGFIISDSTRGRMVAQNPPHLCQYAFWFPSDLLQKNSGRSLFWVALYQAALLISRTTRKRISFYYCDRSHDSLQTQEQQLLADVNNRQLAGIISAMPLSTLAQDTIRQIGLPCCCIPVCPQYQGMSCVAVNVNSFIDRALAYLAGRGRRKVAFLTTTPSNAHFEILQEKLGNHDLETKPYWYQGVSYLTPENARNVAHLMMQLHRYEPFDALIILDDNLVETTLQGVVSAGFPAKLDIIAHCNFPSLIPSVLPVVRLGYRASDTIERSLELIDAQRLGSPPESVFVDAFFEDEVIRDSPAALEIAAMEW